MTAKIGDGKDLARRMREKLSIQVADLRARGVVPGLAVVLVGDDPASKVYVASKGRACEQVEIYSDQINLPADTSQRELLSVVQELNRRPDIHGILVQLPLPPQIDEQAVLLAVDPDKDVDAFHPVNVGKIMLGHYQFLPCTPAGVMEMLDDAGVEIQGKNCVVVGRSNIVGKPMAMLLLHRSGTVTVCHSKTRNLPDITRSADILVAAVGRPRFITGDMIKPGAVVVDVGINRLDSGKLAGDVDFDSVAPLASYITPVPGGVGPMTITMLLKNTVKAAGLVRGIDE